MNRKLGRQGACFAIAALVLAGCASQDIEAADDPDGLVESAESSDEDSRVSRDQSNDAAELANPGESVAAPDAGTESEQATPRDEDNSNRDSEINTSRRDPAMGFGVDNVFDENAAPNLLWFTPFEPGTYRTGALGTPMSFTTIETLSTQINGEGLFVISDTSSQGPDDRELVFLRVSNFGDPTAPDTAIDEQVAWPNDDFLGWLDNLDESIITSAPVETTVNQLRAITVDIQLADDAPCGLSPGQCVGFAFNNGQDSKPLNRGARYRVWVVEQEEEDPLLIISAVSREEDNDWFARSDLILDTVAFGDPAPNPIQPLKIGENQLEILGGITFSLPDNLPDLADRPRAVTVWPEREFIWIPIAGFDGAFAFANRLHDLDGNQLETSDDVVRALIEAGVDTTEIAPTTIDGIAARVFDVGSATSQGEVALRFNPLDVADPFLGWNIPRSGRIWLIESDNAAVMLLSSASFVGTGDASEIADEVGQAIVGSLQFVE